jgi:hypothetical protein
MAGPADVRVTTDLLWRTTVLFSVVAVALLPLLARLVPRQRFATLIVSKPPLLQGASPVAAIAVSAPEFALYFSAIVGLAVLSARVADRRRRRSTAGVSGAA